MKGKTITKPSTKPIPTTPSPPTRPGGLATVEAVRLELSRVYRDCRQGLIPAATGTRLTYILQTLAKLIETSDIERRLSALEEKLL